MPLNGKDLLKAFLHDPPDKALDVRGHAARAARYVAAALEEPVDPEELERDGDHLASAVERLPVPRAADGEPAVGPTHGRLRIVHPMSGVETRIPVPPVNEAAVVERIREIAGRFPRSEEKKRFIALWRWLPERLAERHPCFGRLPADTRMPDHTLWHHADVTAAFAATRSGSGRAFLSLSIGPVQSFIAAARSLRDLWTGSMILSWLAYRGMRPVIERFGPASIVYPYLRGTPFLDLDLSAEGVAIPDAPPASGRVACLPNRFVALVEQHGEIEAEDLARECREAVQDAWKAIAGKVREKLQPWLPAGWDRRWDAQIEGFFDVRTAVLPWREKDDERLADLLRGSDSFETAFPDASAVRSLAEKIEPALRPGYVQAAAGQWQYRMELSARLLEAKKTVRHAPRLGPPSGDSPPKCSLMGSHEQMGPADLEESSKFWSEAQKISVEGVRIRDRERLCAVALVKRFAGPAFFREKLRLGKEDLRMEDTATVAASCWIKRAESQVGPLPGQGDRTPWNGQWLHWVRRDPPDDEPCPEPVWDWIRRARDKSGPPPTYYAILAMDGDSLGIWLKGSLNPKVGEIFDPAIRSYYQRRKGERALEARRPNGPALHAAISEALSNFAIRFVPEIVERHNGTVIYAGGDDVLALCPAETVPACASELNETYRCEWKTDAAGRDRLLMGSRATLSAGIAIVHYKEDLRAALQVARDAERAAKCAGRDAVGIAVCRRSGERSMAVCPWSFLKRLDDWRRTFASASDRWAYSLARDAETLAALPEAAVQAEIKRHLQRAEVRLFQPDDVAGAFREYLEFRRNRKAASEPEERNPLQGPVQSFVTLCQTASFLARGRDR